MMLTLFLPVVEERTLPDRVTNWKFKYMVGKVANSNTTLSEAGLGYTSMSSKKVETLSFFSHQDNFSHK